MTVEPTDDREDSNAQPKLDNEILEWRVFYALTVVSVLASIAVIPFTLLLIRARAEPLPAPPAVLIAISTIACTIVLAVLTKLGLRLGRQMDYEIPITALLLARDTAHARRWKLRLASAAAIGLVFGAGIHAISSVFTDAADHPAEIEVAILNAPVWQRVLVAMSAGVREEIFFRLGLMTVCARLWATLLRISITGSLSAWLGNAVAALAFGLIHIPNVYLYGEFDAALAMQAVAYNASVGLTCGWVYWRWGIESAMVLHASVVVTTMILIPWAFA